jgi:hypothetical protein
VVESSPEISGHPPEATAGIGTHPHVAIVLTVEEADEAQAIEKYRAAHPDVPEYATFILQVIVDQVAMTTGGSRADVCRDRA